MRQWQPISSQHFPNLTKTAHVGVGVKAVTIMANWTKTLPERAQVAYKCMQTWPKQNIEGLTWDEWFGAANCFGSVFPDTNVGRALARQCWLAGEDPTDHAARA